MKSWASWLWDLIYLVALCSLVLVWPVHAQEYKKHPDNEKFCYYTAEFSRGIAIMRDAKLKGFDYLVIDDEKYLLPNNAQEYIDNLARQADSFGFTDKQVRQLDAMVEYVWQHPEMDEQELFEAYYQQCANPDHAI